MNLLIAMPGLRSAPTAAGDRAPREPPPDLPVLTSLLARARRLPDATDWRTGVLAGLGGPGQASVPPAAVAAQALSPVVAGSGLCLAAPLHMVAGMSRVYLPPGGWLLLEAEEAVRWQQAFNREFAGPDLQLHAVGNGWLLVGSCAAAARDAAPELLLGEPLARAPAGDAAERALRRLGAEVEIWLAGQALNREREARGLPQVNGLWFWGGARAVPFPPLAHAPATVLVAGEPDAWLAGLAAHCATRPVAVRDWQSMPVHDRTLLVLAPPRAGMSADHWQKLEQHWLAPAAHALRTGQISGLRLQIGATAWQLPDSSPLRWLRRRRPWHRQVAT